MNFRTLFLATIFLILTFLGGIYFYKAFIAPKDTVAQIDSTLIIERIEKVMKVVSVEGHYIEMLNYNKIKYDFPGFRKKAIVEVSGKVSVGYDLENLNISYDTKSKILHIDNFPSPKILSIEANTRYFDLEQGIFNSFNKNELTEIDRESKNIIREKALNDHLIEAAEEQKEEMLMLLIEPLIQSGWKVYINGESAAKTNIKINNN